MMEDLKVEVAGKPYLQMMTQVGINARGVAFAGKLQRATVAHEGIIVRCERVSGRWFTPDVMEIVMLIPEDRAVEFTKEIAKD